MGIPGLLRYLTDTSNNIFTGKVYARRPVVDKDDKNFYGPCLVFDDAVLVKLLLLEWQQQATRSEYGPTRHDAERGGWATQLRAFASEYIKQLIVDLRCTIVWVRDGGVNDKPAMIHGDVFEDAKRLSQIADKNIDCKGSNHINTHAVEVASKLHGAAPTVKVITDAVIQAISDVMLPLEEDQFRTVYAAANCTDGEVWRQAQKLVQRSPSEEVNTFIVSGDTDMLVFGATPPGVGVVLMNFCVDDRQRKRAGAEWSCKRLKPDFSAFMRFTFCTTTDIVSSLRVQARYLPVLAACLGGDLGAVDPGVRDFTIQIKSALIKRHFVEGSGVARAFSGLSGKDVHQQRTNLRRITRTWRPCFYGKFCNRVDCEHEHPPGGRMWCKKEGEDGRCVRPGCHFRHAHPIGFRISKYAREKYNIHSDSPVSDTWGEAASAAQTMHEMQKRSSLGVGRRWVIGSDLDHAKALRTIIFRRSCEFVREHSGSGSWNDGCGELNVAACVENVCKYLEIPTISSQGNDLADAFTRAIGVYDIPPLEENPDPVVLTAPTRGLERRRIRKCCIPDAYALPNDAGYLNYVTEPLRAQLGRELGLNTVVEGVQIGPTYTVKRLLSSSVPLTNGPESAFNIRLREALGFESKNDEDWLKKLDDVIEGLYPLFDENHDNTKGRPPFITPENAWCPALKGGRPIDRQLPSNGAILQERDNLFGCFRTAMLSLTYWEQALRGTDMADKLRKSEVRCEIVDPLERWEIRVFISTFVLGWIQKQLTACPFTLLSTSESTAGKPNSDSSSNRFSSIPRELRRRIFLLVAQFGGVSSDVVLMTEMLNGGEGYLTQGIGEIVFNPEAMFSLYSAAGGATTAHDRDGRVRDKMEAVLHSCRASAASRGGEVDQKKSAVIANTTGFSKLCDELVDRVVNKDKATSDMVLDDLDAENWEELA